MAEVTLIDGRVVDSCSDDWRNECEARHLLDRFPLVDRRKYLMAINQKRGEAAYLRLTRSIVAIWEARKSAREGSPE